MNLPLTSSRRNRARRRLLQMHHAAGVGHIGGNLSALDATLLVFHEYLGDEDRFVLSKGHAAGALYIALWSIGRLTDEALTTFHRDGTLLAGHPPSVGIPDIPFATGSLGHGLSLAAGTALGHRLQGSAARVVCLTSDGEWQEGSTWEALIFACHQRLGNLTVLVDHNELQGFGSTADVASMAPLWEKLAGFDASIDVIDGHDLDALRAVLARPAEPRPRIVVLRTVKGKGVSFMENRMEWHYLPLSDAQFQAALAELGGE
jgi:transketolase